MDFVWKMNGISFRIEFDGFIIFLHLRIFGGLFLVTICLRMFGDLGINNIEYLKKMMKD
jgi:hypothetical protein